jgi:signal transduction histidine kinase
MEERDMKRTNPKAAPLAQVLERALNTVATIATLRGIGVAVDMSVHRPVADEAGLAHVVTHLLWNAVINAPRRTPVTVSAREDQGFVEVSIRDRGLATGEDSRPLVQLFMKRADWDPRVDRERGLPLCRAILDRQGGTIRVDAKSDGNTSWIRIPAGRASRGARSAGLAAISA